jgi:hypothetical protein
MPFTETTLPIDKDELQAILKKYGVVNASLFGSYARGDQTHDSDVDILVTYGDHVSLFDHLNLRADLEEITGKSVDLVSSRSVSKYFAPYIDKDKVSIL